MKVTTYILYIFILFVPITIASGDDWEKRYPKLWQSRLYMILTKGFDEESTQLHSPKLLPYIDGSESTEAIRGVLKDAGKSPFDLYSNLIEILQPEFAELSKDYYREQRESSGVSKEFNEFDAKFFKKLDALTYLFFHGVDWNKLARLSSKEEVMCEAVFFYDLIDFERAITCLDAAPPVVSLTPKIFSNFVADMYLGEAKRPDFSYEGDIETRKWLGDMIEKYEGSHHPQTISLMRRFTRNIRGKVDDKLWNDYMHGMITVHLSAALLYVSQNGLKELYDYLSTNRISNEYMFASEELGPLQPGETKQSLHAFLRTFKLDPSGETATMGIINSGNGLQFHGYDIFNLNELPDTISRIPNAESVFRYIPFVVYDEVPRRDWGPAYTITDSMSNAYFEHKQKRHRFSDYKKWQYIDYQRGGTCSAMSLWVALYWFERESQQNLESFRLALYLEVLKEAAKGLIKLRAELEGLDAKRLESADVESEWNELQLKINEKSEVEDDYLRFFSVAFNSAIRSIRYLHYDPFKQGLDMTSIMQDYADFYGSQGGEKYWQLVKPNIDDLFHSTYFRVLKPMIWVTPLNAPKISTKERDCADYVKHAIKSKDPLNFVKAVIGGTESKCHSKAFFRSISFGADALNLRIHHQDLIIRALIRETQSLPGRRTRASILAFLEKLITDHNFRLFPAYNVQPSGVTNFSKNIYQVIELENDDEVQQFASNCDSFEPLAVLVLSTANDLVRSIKETLSENLESTEEHKLYIRLVRLASAELQRMNLSLYAKHLALIKKVEQTGVADYIDYFKPPKGWNQDDYKLPGKTKKKPLKK